MKKKPRSSKETRKSRLAEGCVIAAFCLAIFTYWPEQADLLQISDGNYRAVSLFFMSYDEAGVTAPYFVAHIARLLCPLALCTFAMSLFTTWVDHFQLQVRSLGRQVSFGKLCFGRDAASIYGTGDIAVQAAEGTHLIHTGDYFLNHAKHHIILMDSDEESFRFFRNHSQQLSGKNVCIGLWQMSSFLMKGSANVSYFNIYEEVARDYWKRYRMQREEVREHPYHIVILGYCQDNLGYHLLRYGLMNNLVSTDQKMIYDVFCEEEEAVRGFEYLKLMNGDQIKWHTQAWQQKLEILQRADRILLCRQVNPNILNQLMLSCTGQMIDYYNPQGYAYPGEYAYANLRSFGCTSSILDEDAILKNKLYAAAMSRHYQYTKQNGSQEERLAIQTAEANHTQDALCLQMWQKLSGFLKNSNAACADFYEIYPVSECMDAEELEERAKLEHIRWCRFHYLCGWQYGEPENSKKDSVRRIHRCLVEWESLSEEEREKDRQQVRCESIAM